MEGVNPIRSVLLGKWPTPVRALMAAAVLKSSERGLAGGNMMGEPGDPNQEGCSKQVGFVYCVTIDRGIAERERRSVWYAIQIMKDEVPNGNRQLQGQAIAC